MTTIVIQRRDLPESIVQGHRLGRHVNHDSRSKSYRVEPVTTPKSMKWERKTAILDQGALGSCTGNATVGVLGTDPFYTTLTGPLFDETEAVKIYSLATKLDPYAGFYPPTDTGSDGLSVAKVAQNLGLISGYTHALSMNDFISGMQKGPAITGINWRADMDLPTSEGIVRYSGNIRGGHEIEANELDLERGLVWFPNSWGASWSYRGYFAMSLEDYSKALSEEGDATFFIPNNQPPPIPNPKPLDPEDQDLIHGMDPWAATIISRFTKSGKARTSYEKWKGIKMS